MNHRSNRLYRKALLCKTGVRLITVSWHEIEMNVSGHCESLRRSVDGCTGGHTSQPRSHWPLSVEITVPHLVSNLKAEIYFVTWKPNSSVARLAAAWLGWLPRSGYSDITQLAAYTTPRVVLSEEKTAAIYATQYSSITLFYWCLSIPWRNLHTQSQSAH